MHKTLRRSLAIAALGTVATLGTTAVASAQDRPGSKPLGNPFGNAFGPGPASHAVFVQTDGSSGNAVDVFDRHSDGRLSLRQTVPAGGLGGQTAGSAADHLASQGSLVYDAKAQLLFAVNAGSDSVSVLSARGDRVRLVQVVPSGGAFPDSIAVRGDLVYVLDAGGAGTVTGYRIVGHHLLPLPGSSRSLGLSNTTPPNFLTSPGQVGFSPSGSQLIVTTKASTSSLDVFTVNRAGLLSSTPTVTADPGNVPFAFTTSPSGQVVVAEAGDSTLHTYSVAAGGTLTSLSAPVPDGQAALCWITSARGHYYVANAGSNDVSAYTVAPDGTPSLDGSTGIAGSNGIASSNGIVATTDAGPIDMAAPADGHNLYVEAGAAGAVDEFQINADGSLDDLGNVAGLGAGIEGIAAD